MPKLLTKKFKAKVTGVKLKGALVNEGDEVAVDGAEIVVTLAMSATATTLRMLDFFNGAKPTKNNPNKYMDCTIEGQQYELELED